MSSKSLITLVILIFLIGALMLPFLVSAQMKSSDLTRSVNGFSIISKIIERLAGNITSFFIETTETIAGAGLKIVSSITNLSTAFIAGSTDDSLDESSDKASLSDSTIGPGITQEDSRPEAPTLAEGPLRQSEDEASEVGVPTAERVGKTTPKIVTISKEDTIEQETKDSVKEEAATQEREQVNEEIDDSILIQEPVAIKFDLPPPSGPVIPPTPTISLQDNTTFNAASDTNSELSGNQIILSGTAKPEFLLTINQNPTYNTTTAKDGTWTQEVTLQEGANDFVITTTYLIEKTSASNQLTINLDSIAPTTTIAVANYASDSDQFKVNWAADAEDVEFYEVEYKISSTGEWQDWGNATTTASGKNYQNATNGTYYFRVRGTDIHGNIGTWQELDPVVIDLYQVLINEIQTNDAEFVELYNPRASQISLKGYYFSYYPSTQISWNGISTPNGPYRNQPFPNNAKIPANGYFLIGLDGYPDSGGNPDADWQVYVSNELSDSAGTVAIFPFDPTSATTSQYAYDNRVDAIGWGPGISLYETNSATTTPVADESLARDSNNTDTDNNSADFTVATSTTPTNSAGETYIPPPPPPPPGQADFLVVPTTTVAIDGVDNTKVVGITVENTTTTAIVIDKMTVSWTGAPGGTKIEEITIDGGSLWSGKGNSGSLLDIIDFILAAGAGTYSINSLDFNKNMTGTTIDITFIMEDGTTKTVSSIQP